MNDSNAMTNNEKAHWSFNAILTDAVPTVPAKMPHDCGRRAALHRSRGGLLAGAAIGALCLAPLPAHAAPDACTVSGNVATCSGDQSGGLDAVRDFPADVDLLVIENLTGDIAPVGTTGDTADGVRIATLPDPAKINIRSNTGDYSIIARIHGFSLRSTGSLYLDHTGNIQAGGDGIRALSFSRNGNSGDVGIKASGQIAASGGGISALSLVETGNGNSGVVTVLYDGSMTSPGSGIHAESRIVDGNGNAGAVFVVSTGSLGGRISAASTVSGDGNSGIVGVSHQGSQVSGIVATSRVGGNGNAGNVTIVRSGGASSGGLIAESVVAGVGNSGVVSVSNAGNITKAGGEAAAIDASSRAETDGNSGTVAVDSSGRVQSDSTGILAKSTATGAGSAGAVGITSTGDITAGANGIDAASVASGQGGAGMVTVTARGNITADYAAIRAVSTGASGQGNISVDIDSGVYRGKTAGVEFVGGATNLLKIGTRGVIFDAGGGSVIGGDGNETIDNLGTLQGDIRLGGGTNAINNGGIYHSGSVIDLGASGVLTNGGVFSVGNVRVAPRTTELTGNYVQSAGGLFLVDINGATADRLNVSGTANVGGKVLARFAGMDGTSKQYTIMSAAGGLTRNGVTLAGPADTAVMDYELLFPNANDMVLSVTANFVAGGLTPNQKATAQHLQDVLVAGGGDLGQVYGHLGGIERLSDYAVALDRLHPEPYLAQTQSMLFSGLSFADGVLTCSDLTGANVVKRDGEHCAWTKVGGSRTSRDRTRENIGYDNDAWSASGGLQFALAPNWIGGISVGYERSSLKVDDRARTSGDLFHLGAGAQYRNGGWELSGIVSGGFGSFDTTRFGLVPGVNASGSTSSSYVSGRLRAAYMFGTETAYLKPMIDFDATALRRGGFEETGAGTAGLRVRGQTDGVLSVAPGVELGGQFQVGSQTVLQPYLRGGVRVFGKSDLSATASFIGSPSGVGPFTVTMPLERTVGELSAGVDLIHAGRLKMGVSYEGRFGADTQRHTGAFSLRATF